MKKEYQKAHYAELKKRYGIKDLDTFRRSARRYECKLRYLYTLACDDERRGEWAEKEAERVEAAARRNLAKYCRYHKVFERELFINSDPRGYALKLSAKKVTLSFMCHVDRDWGADYIIAPNND